MRTDIIAEDRDRNPILLVEVMVPVASPEDMETFVSRFLQFVPTLPFGMLVDLESIHLVGREMAATGAVLVTLNTRDVLRFYDPEFAGKDSHYGSRRIFREYVATLVEAWLRDLAYHWKSEEPPGTAELAPTGLLVSLRGGMTRRDVAIAVNSLY
jgi:hypothetical protein